MIKDKSVIVTGAASGIGSACARRLLADGNRVVAVDLDRERLVAELGDETDALKFAAGDVARTATADRAAKTAVEAFYTIDGLAHFAAAHSKLNWESADEDEFNRILSTNVTGSFLMAKAAAKVMIDQGVKGAMVLTASGGVLMGGTGENGRGGPAYTTSKGGVLVLVRTWQNLGKVWHPSECNQPRRGRDRDDVRIFRRSDGGSRGAGGTGPGISARRTGCRGDMATV